MRNNKRIFSLVMIVLLCVVCLTGCSGSNTEEIKEELRGKWSYDFYASYVGQHCHQVYEFKGDGTFVSAWIVDEAPKKNSYHSGTYKIDGKRIVLTPDDGSTPNIIEFSYNNGVLKLFDKGTDGSVEEQLNRQ